MGWATLLAGFGQCGFGVGMGIVLFGMLVDKFVGEYAGFRGIWGECV